MTKPTAFRCACASLLLVLLAAPIFAQSGTITTIAGISPPVSGTAATTQAIGPPSSVRPDGAGGFYFSSSLQNRVYRVAPNGTLTVVAGTGAFGFSGDGGPATSARLASPLGLALDTAGNLFIADYDGARIRKVTPNGVITTVAGNGLSAFGGDGGPATQAGIGPTDVAVDAAGNLFIADNDNHRVRKVTPNGVITTLTGNGIAAFTGDGGLASAAQVANPRGVAVDSAGNVFIADYDNNRIRKISTDGLISTVAGNGTFAFSGDGDLATLAGLSPTNVAVDGAGNIFIADYDNHRIRKVVTAGTITSIAGTGVLGFSGDNGIGTSAQLAFPVGVAIDTAGNVLIADSRNERIRRVNSVGFIATVAGNGLGQALGDGGSATLARLIQPSDVAVDSAGNVFIADALNDRVRKVTPGGIITTIAGNGTSGFSGDGGPATSAQLSAPNQVVLDGAGNLFIAEYKNGRVRKVSPNGVITTVAGDGSFLFNGDGVLATAAGIGPVGIAIDAAGNLFIADWDNERIRKVGTDGRITTVAGTGIPGFSGDGGAAVSAQISSPICVDVDSAGNLYICDYDNARLRKVTPNGVITTHAGNGSFAFSGDGGPAVSAGLAPAGVAVDASGNVFIADYDNNRIRRVSAATITTVAGGGPEGAIGDGPATSAYVNGPSGIALDSSGNVFVAEGGSSRVRKVTFSQPQTSFSMVDRGGMSLRTSGTQGSIRIGYATIQPNAGSSSPSGLAIFGYRQNNVLVSEAGVPATAPMRSGRIYAEVGTTVNTGIAIANPNAQTATISFFFTNAGGNFGAGTTTIPARGQIANFLNETIFNGPSTLSGTFTFNSDVPVSVIALRGLTNERSEFLITTLPVANLDLPAAAGTVIFPHFAEGGGWTSQIILVNPTDNPLVGTIRFLDNLGRAVTLGVNNQTGSSFTYQMPARTSLKLQTSGAPSVTVGGSVRVIPTNNTPAPSGLAIFSFRKNGIVVSEAGVPAVAAGSAFRLYAETVGTIRTGIAITNNSSFDTTVTLELTQLNGSSTGLTGTISIPANGQVAKFLDEVQGFGSLQTPFQGVLRVSSSASISVMGLRGRNNERNDFLITTIPSVNEAAPASNGPVYFPHIADSGGYTTQFILFSGQPGSSPAGTIQLFSQSGSTLTVTVQ